jgi:hypothetical protein
MVRIEELKKYGYKKYAEVTVHNTAEEILKLMNKHKGKNNRINRDDLIWKVFNVNIKELKPLNQILIRDVITKSISKIRGKSNCFLTYYIENNIGYYFVITNEEEAKIYHTRANNTINAFKRMKLRADKSIEEKWYNNKGKWDKEYVSKL